MASLYNAVGNAMLLVAGGNPADLYLYSAAGQGWAETALFRIGSGTLEWIDSMDDPFEHDKYLFDSIMALWEAEEPAKRWTVMEFEVRGTTFNTQLWYEGELPPNELGFERRDELIRRRFGNLEVIYPPEPAY
ncbi:MAG: hypothetical protein ABIU18_04340 [Novosphingobium sp.]